MAQWNFQQDKVLSALGLSMIILASSSDSAAQTCLGDIYLRGDATTGVCRDPKKAFEFFEMAALAGDVKACSALGWMHVQSKSALSGEVFLTLAAQKGDVCAMRNLGMLLDVQTRNYSQGEPDYAINRKLEYAVSLLRVAAFGNDHAACFHLAKLCEEGRGCHEDLGEALLWYRKAAAHIPEAAFRAGLLMMRGVGPYGLEEGQQWVNQAQSLNPRLAITQT
jgi:TPR repeat protein